DVTAPALLDREFTTGTVDTSTGDATITITAQVGDDISGPSILCFFFQSPSGLQLNRSSCPLPLNETLVTPLEGTLVFPQFSESGVWRAGATISDIVGNSRDLVQADPIAAGLPSTITVASGTPEMPLITSVTPGNGRLFVWFFPGLDGGSPITNYEYSLDNGQSWIPRVPASTASPFPITGLTNGVQYSVRLRAVNANGNGTPSLPVTATPRAPAGVVLDDFDPGANGPVYSLAVQPDGKILVGGVFTTLG